MAQTSGFDTIVIPFNPRLTLPSDFDVQTPFYVPHVRPVDNANHMVFVVPKVGFRVLITPLDPLPQQQPEPQQDRQQQQQPQQEQQQQQQQQNEQDQQQQQQPQQEQQQQQPQQQQRPSEPPSPTPQPSPHHDNPADDDTDEPPPPKRQRGRPKGAKNKITNVNGDAKYGPTVIALARISGRRDDAGLAIVKTALVEIVMLHFKQLSEPRPRVRYVIYIKLSAFTIDLFGRTVNSKPPSDFSFLIVLIESPPQVILLLQGLEGLLVIPEF